ncbi:MAG: hypothetical protein ACI9FJ_001775 [Alteromonadaceae bacterium]|jgi:hypothetical protein
MNRRRRVNTIKSKSFSHLSVRRRAIKKNTAATITARHNGYRQTLIKEAAEAQNDVVETEVAQA